MMNCEDAKPLLDSFADGELDLVNHVQFEAHLDECLSCDHTYRNTNALKNALSNDELYFKAPAELRMRIRSSLEETTHQSPWSGLLKWRWMPTMAAAVIVVVALFSSLAILRPSGKSEELLANEMVSAHVRSLMLDHATDVISTDQHTVKPWFEGKLDFSPPVVDLAQQGYTLIGGRLDYLGGRPVAALVYQRRQHLINVFIYPAQDQNTDGGVSTRQGFNVIHWTKSGMTFWAVSDLNTAELQDFTHLLQSS
jgi:anti-sigma factor RsiW